MFQRLGLFITFPVVVVTLLAAGVSAFLNYGKFAATLTEVESARFALAARGVKVGIEANLNLGLSLPELPLAQAIIDRERTIIAETRAILIFSADGKILFSAGAASGFDHAPSGWLREGEWTTQSTAWQVAGTSLANSFGVPVGGVAVLYPRDRRERLLALMAGKLGLAAGLAGLATTFFVLLGMFVFLRRTGALVNDMADSLAPGAEGGDEPVRAVKTRVRQVLAGIAEMSQRLPERP